MKENYHDHILYIFIWRSRGRGCQILIKNFHRFHFTSSHCSLYLTYCWTIGTFFEVEAVIFWENHTVSTCLTGSTRRIWISSYDRYLNNRVISKHNWKLCGWIRRSYVLLTCMIQNTYFGVLHWISLTSRINSSFTLVPHSYLEQFYPPYTQNSFSSCLVVILLIQELFF